MYTLWFKYSIRRFIPDGSVCACAPETYMRIFMVELLVIVPNCRQLKMSISSRMNKQTYSYNAIWYSNENEWTVTKWNKSKKHNAMWRKTDRKESILYESIYIMFKNEAKLLIKYVVFKDISLGDKSTKKSKKVIAINSQDSRCLWWRQSL